MTTPIIEFSYPEPQFMGYMLQCGGTTQPFTSGAVDLTGDMFDLLTEGNVEPIRVIPDNAFMGIDGIYHRVPTAITTKLLTAYINDISGDDPQWLCDFSDYVIVSTDGRIVFKPNLVRALSDLVKRGIIAEFADLDDYSIGIMIEAAPAYTNPSGATPEYEPAMLTINMAMSGNLANIPFTSPVDSTPYIVYSETTGEENPI